jgi:hypothetical protein
MLTRCALSALPGRDKHRRGPLVQSVEAHPAIQVARADQVDLRHVPGPSGGRRRVRDALARPAAGTLALGHASTRDDPLVRTGGTTAPSFSSSQAIAGAPELRPRVGLQPGAHLEHRRLDPSRRAVRHPPRRSRATLRPAGIVRVIARRPLRHPLPRPAQIPGDRSRRLACQPPTRRLATRRDLKVIHPILPGSIDTSA